MIRTRIIPEGIILRGRCLRNSYRAVGEFWRTRNSDRMEETPKVSSFDDIRNIPISDAKGLSKLCVIIIQMGFSGLSEESFDVLSDYAHISDIYQSLLANSLELLETKLVKFSDLCLINSTLSSIVAYGATKEHARDAVCEVRLLEYMIKYIKFIAETEKSGKYSETSGNIPVDFLKHTYRAIGNSCFNFPDNCKVIEEVPNAIETLVRCGQIFSISGTVYFLGTLLNIVIQNEKLLNDISNYEGICDIIMSAIDYIADATEPVDDESYKSASFALSVLLSIHETSKNTCPVEKVSAKVYIVIKKIVSIIEKLVEQNAYPSLNIIECLRAALNFADAPYGEDESSSRSFELQMIPQIITIAKNYKHMANAPDDIKALYSTCNSLAASILNNIASCNDIAPKLVINDDLIDVVLHWVRDAIDDPTNSNVASTTSSFGLYCLGNICRNDSHSSIFLNNKLIINALIDILTKGIAESKNIELPKNLDTTSSLVSDLAKSLPITTPESANLTKTIYAAIGTIRNLCINSDGPAIFNKLGLVNILCELINDKLFLFARHEIASVIRIICTNDIVNFFPVLSGEFSSTVDEAHLEKFEIPNNSPLIRLINISLKAVDENDAPFRNEVARLCNKLVKIAYQLKINRLLSLMGSINNFIPCIFQTITGISVEEMHKITAMCLNIIPRDLNPVLKPSRIYETVQSESILSILLLSDHINNYTQYDIFLPVFIKSISDVITAAKTDVSSNQTTIHIQNKVNACILLKKLIETYSISSDELPDALIKFLKGISSTSGEMQPGTAPKTPQESLCLISRDALNKIK